MLPGLPRVYQHTLCRAWLCWAMHVSVVGEAPVGQPESAAAHWLPASPRVTHSAPMAWALRARAPVAAGSLPRATRSTPMERGCATRRWANAVERRTPSPEREAAISLATCARARSAHAIGAERVARGDAGSLGQHPAEPPAVRSGCSTATRSPLHTTGRLLPPSATLATFAKRGRN